MWQFRFVSEHCCTTSAMWVQLLFFLIKNLSSVWGISPLDWVWEEEEQGQTGHSSTRVLNDHLVPWNKKTLQWCLKLKEINPCWACARARVPLTKKTKRAIALRGGNKSIDQKSISKSRGFKERLNHQDQNWNFHLIGRQQFGQGRSSLADNDPKTWYIDVFWEFYIRHICMYLLVFPSTGKSDKGLQIKLSNIFHLIWLLSWWLANLCLSLLHWALATLRQLEVFFFRCNHITFVDFDPRNGFSPCYTEIAEDSRCLKTFHIATGAKVVLTSVTGKSGKYFNISQIF